MCGEIDKDNIDHWIHDCKNLDRTRENNLGELIRTIRAVNPDNYRQATISYILKGEIIINISKKILEKREKNIITFMNDFKEQRENALITIKEANKQRIKIEEQESIWQEIKYINKRKLGDKASTRNE